MSDPKILFWDTEWTPAISYTWSNRPKFLSNEFLVEPARLLCWGARWYDKKKVILSDEREGRMEMLTGLRDILTEADMVVSYNGQAFDTRKVNSEFMQLGITPPAPYKEIDLYRVIKKHASFYSHKLDFVGEHIIGQRKVDTGGFALWKEVMEGDEKAWKKMLRYQKQDVNLLVELFDELKPWIRMPHPVSAKPGIVCRNCGGEDLQRRGTARTLQGEYPRFSCKSCGSWSRGLYRTPVGETRAIS